MGPSGCTLRYVLESSSDLRGFTVLFERFLPLRGPYTDIDAYSRINDPTCLTKHLPSMFGIMP